MNKKLNISLALICFLFISLISPLTSIKVKADDLSQNNDVPNSITFDLSTAEVGDVFIQYDETDSTKYSSIEILAYEPLETNTYGMRNSSWSGGMPDGTWTLRASNSTGLTNAYYDLTVKVSGYTTTILDMYNVVIDVSIGTIQDKTYSIRTATSSESSNADSRVEWLQIGSNASYYKDSYIGCRIKYQHCQYQVYWDMM